MVQAGTKRSTEWTREGKPNRSEQMTLVIFYCIVGETGTTVISNEHHCRVEHMCRDEI